MDVRRDEDLLERLLAGGAGGGVLPEEESDEGTDEELGLDGADLQRAREWRVAVERIRQGLNEATGGEVAPREAAQAVDRSRQARLRKQILALTTREDISWRGDLRLVTDYVRRELRHSLLLRVAAASLLFHLAALPVLAYFVWSEAKEPVEMGFQPWDLAHPEPPYAEQPLEEGDARLPIEKVDQEPTVRDQPLPDPVKRD